MSDNHPKIVALLKKHHIGILATSSTESIPHAASVYFYSDPDFKIYFVTKAGTTKYKNMTSNPHVALVVYEASSQVTLQINGTVQKITDEDQGRAIYSKVMQATENTSYNFSPPFNKLDAGELVAFCLNPERIRLAEYFQTSQEQESKKDVFDIIEFPPAV